MYSYISKKILCCSLLFFFISITICSLTSCRTDKTETSSVSKTSFLLNTAVTITLYGTEDETLINECFSLCRQYEETLSRTIETSEISMINARKTDTVSNETLSLINTGLYYSRLSEGAFDITIGSVSSLWDFTAESPSLPDNNLLEEALSHVGYEKIFIDGQKISFTDDGTLLDLGAIAKGYIADRLKDFLLENQIESATINLGGNVLCIGGRPDGSDFRIGIQRPFDEQGNPILIVSLSDWSVVTSGVYERYFKLDDTFYHHILNPATGYPVDNELLSVTILSKTSVDGDGLSTACFSLGLNDGMDLINRLDETYAIFITDDYKIHYSEGLKETFSISE